MTDFLEADQADALAALQRAADLAAGGFLPAREKPAAAWLEAADEAYRWLRRRDSLRAAALEMVPGAPFTEGTVPVAAMIDLSDTQEIAFTLTGTDAKSAAVPLDPGCTAAWTLSDPDASGAVLTVSDGTMSATVAAGTPTANLSVSVVVTNPDGSTLAGAEGISVAASAATAVALVAGAPGDAPAA